MDEPSEPPRVPAQETVKCGMCQQQAPAYQVRTVSGRPLCLGCLTAWYDEDGEDEDE